MIILDRPQMLRNRIRELRQVRGLSQEALASRVGVSNQQVSNLETGVSELSLRWIQRLAEAFDVPSEDVIGAGVDEPLLRAVLTAVVQLVDSRRYRFTPAELAEISTHLYQEMRVLEDIEKSADTIALAAKTLCDFAAGGQKS